MTSFLLQLWALFSNGYLQTYFIFFVLINAFWWLRVYLASRNKRYTKPFRGSYSVIIPVFREDPELFEQCLSNIRAHSKPKEVIVSIDDYTHAEERDIAIAEKYATKVLRMDERVGKREQFYQASLAMSKKVDVVLTVDSDTLWDETTMNILKPFMDPKVGAASGRQTIFDYKRNWVRHIAEWYEDLRFRVLLPFQSYFGQVQVIPGRTLAIRAELFKELAAELRNETFLGRRIITSDDASLTMGALGKGYKTVYQDDSLAQTDAPDTVKRFWLQYLRWYRGSARRFFHRFTTLARLNPLVFLANLEFLFGTFLYAAILATFAFKLNFRMYEIVPVVGTKLTESFNPWFILLLVLGYFISSFIRNLPHLIHHKEDVLFLPVFAVFSFFFMPVLKLASLFSFFENGWMTRRQHNAALAEKNVWPTRAVAVVAGLAVMAITLPIPYGIDIRPTHIPLVTITNNEAPEYYRARQVAEALTNNDPTDDPSPERIDHIYEKYVAYHKEESPDANLKVAAKCAEDKLKTEQATEDPLKPIQECLSKDAQVAYAEPAPKPAEPESAVAGATNEKPLDKTIDITVKEGDNMSLLVRGQISSLQPEPIEPLNAAQVAYIEATYLEQTQASDELLIGSTVTINLDLLRSLREQAQKLTPKEQQHWQERSSPSQVL